MHRFRSPKVLLLGDGIWERNFHRDPKVIGRSVMVNGTPHTVVGVLPATQDFPANVGSAIYTPLAMGDKTQEQRDNSSYAVIGVLRGMEGVVQPVGPC